MLAALASSPATKALDPDPFPRHSLRHAVYAALLHFGFETADEENDKRLGFFTNNFELPALTIAQLYKCRWQVELFFKWIKQHLRIKTFFGTKRSGENANLHAISVYVLVAIVKKRLGVAASLYTILQILSLTLFEKTPLDQLLNDIALQNLDSVDSNQLNLFS